MLTSALSALRGIIPATSSPRTLQRERWRGEREMEGREREREKGEREGERDGERKGRDSCTCNDSQWNGRVVFSFVKF